VSKVLDIFKEITNIPRCSKTYEPFINYIQELKEEIQTIKEQLTRIEEYYKPKYDLTKQSGVIRFLDISESTLVKYRKEGILKQGYHYNREIKGNKSIITYVSGAIEEFKKEKLK